MIKYAIAQDHPATQEVIPEETKTVTWNEEELRRQQLNILAQDGDLLLEFVGCTIQTAIIYPSDKFSQKGGIGCTFCEFKMLTHGSSCSDLVIAIELIGKVDGAYKPIYTFTTSNLSVLCNPRRSIVTAGDIHITNTRWYNYIEHFNWYVKDAGYWNKCRVTGDG